MSAYSDAVIADTPYVYWRLNQTSGTNAADSGSLGYAGTYTAGFTLNQRPLLLSDSDPSVTLNGTTGYVTGTGALAVNTGAFTFECWQRVTTALSTTGQYMIIDQDGGTGHTGRYLYVRDLGYIFGFFDGTTLGFAGSAVGPKPNLNTINHIVGTFDGSTNVIVYVNGVAYPAGTTSPRTVVASASPLRSGASNTATPANFYGGQLQHVAVYNYALTQAQVTHHYQVGGYDPATVLNNYQQIRVPDGLSVSEKIR